MGPNRHPRDLVGDDITRPSDHWDQTLREHRGGRHDTDRYRNVMAAYVDGVAVMDNAGLMAPR